MKLADFGPFVIFAAVYAAGTLGLPQISFFAYQLKVGEMASAFVALFGIPAVLGLTLGQFIANLGLQSKPIAMLSPAFSFVGLLVIYYLRKRSALVGCLAYVAITAAWIAFLLPILNPSISTSVALFSAFAGQIVSVMIGYLGYLVARRTSGSPTQQSKSEMTGTPEAVAGGS